MLDDICQISPHLERKKSHFKLVAKCSLPLTSFLIIVILSIKSSLMFSPGDNSVTDENKESYGHKHAKNISKSAKEIVEIQVENLKQCLKLLILALAFPGRRV